MGVRERGAGLDPDGYVPEVVLEAVVSGGLSVELGGGASVVPAGGGLVSVGGAFVVVVVVVVGGGGGFAVVVVVVVLSRLAIRTRELARAALALWTASIAEASEG